MFDAISTNAVGKTCCHAQSWQPCYRGSVTGTLICDAMPQERRAEPKLMWVSQPSGDCGDALAPSIELGSSFGAVLALSA